MHIQAKNGKYYMHIQAKNGKYSMHIQAKNGRLKYYMHIQAKNKFNNIYTEEIDSQENDFWLPQAMESLVWSAKFSPL